MKNLPFEVGDRINLDLEVSSEGIRKVEDLLLQASRNSLDWPPHRPLPSHCSGVKNREHLFHDLQPRRYSSVPEALSPHTWQ
jgi:hypothetical protein